MTSGTQNYVTHSYLQNIYQAFSIVCRIQDNSHPTAWKCSLLAGLGVHFLFVPWNNFAKN